MLIKYFHLSDKLLKFMKDLEKRVIYCLIIKYVSTLKKDYKTGLGGRKRKYNRDSGEKMSDE